MRPTSMKFVAGLAAVAVGFSTPAAAATRALSSAESSVSPWVTLSALGSSSSSAALCGSAAAAAAAATAAQAAPGCVLPVIDAPVPVAEVPQPVAAAPYAEPVRRGFSVLPLLLGLVGLAAIVAVLLGGGDDEDDINVNPITQP